MHFEYVLKSININYKSWIILFICLFLIDCYSIPDLITLIIMLLAVHLFHYFSHYPVFYPFNCSHLYHHENNNWFSHIIQIIIEFVCILMPIISKYYFCENSKFFNTYLIIYIYYFYTTVHTINYSFFHVNNVHEYHHVNKLRNAGPDICDILFQTKHDVANQIENTDHYIPNIISGVFVIYILKYLYTLLEKKINLFNYFFYLMYFLVLFLFISSIFIFLEDIDKYYKNKLEKFKKN